MTEDKVTPDGTAAGQLPSPSTLPPPNDPTNDGAGAGGGAAGPTAAPPDRPTYYRGWSLGSLAAAAVVALLVLFAAGLLCDHWMLSDEEWCGLAPSAKLASKLATPITMLGVILVSLGAALVVAEWRGTLQSESEKAAAKAAAATQSRGALAEIPAIVDAVGKLRGAALLVVAGALMLGGSAWIAASAAKSSPNEPPASCATQFGTQKH